MNTKSIRFRLFLWHSLTLFVGLLVTFISFYLVTRNIIFKQVDRELSTHADKLSEIVTMEGVDIHDLLLSQQLYIEFSNIPGMVVVLLDQDGQIVRGSHSSPDLASYSSSIYKKVVVQGEVYENQLLGETPMRFVGKPFFFGDKLYGVVIVAHPIDAIQKSFSLLVSVLLVIFFFIFIPIILSGNFLILKILRPLLAISDQISKITSENLDKRIDNPGTRDEIENLAHTFNDLLNRLQDSFGRERQFIGDVAHELKTPVTTLKGQIELSLAKTRTIKEYKQDFAESLSDINHLSNKIKNILDLAWLNAENADIPNNKVNLTQILVELKEIAEKLAFQKKINIKSQIISGVYVRGAEDKLMRAFLNILDNAIKYTPNAGEIKLLLKKKEGRCLIEVKDSGPGIAKEDLPHIFERFYRGSKTSKIYGSGLGLAISQGIIKAHGGSISISSKLNKGTSVLVDLPIIS